MSWEVEVERGKGKLINLLGWRTSTKNGLSWVKKWELVPRNERKQGQFCGCKKRHKNRCNICVGKDTGNVSDEDYTKHYEMKCGALEQKEVDKNNGDGNSVVYCCDTEAVLISPRNKSNAMYYRTNLNIHNLTFYDPKTHEVLKYLWNEVDGQIECDNFNSIHVDYTFFYL